MKRFRYIIVLVATALLVCNVQARTLEIKISTCPKPYVDNIRKMTANLGYYDELILNFDKAGKYEFDGSLKFKCNTTIKGISPEATKVIVKEGIVGGKSKMLDDAFFAVHGTSNHKVKTEIKDIYFELASHKDVLWATAPKYIIKIVYGDGVLVDNVVTKTQNAFMTNLDFRESDNITVQNSEFENYNNCDDGGCLWSRGSQHNIVVKNNVFRKYGKDEALAFWGGRSNSNEVTEMKNIIVDGNDLHYGVDQLKSKKDLMLTIFINFYHFKEDVFHINNKCAIDSIVLKNNFITIDDVIFKDIAFKFDALATVGNIEVSNNRIVNTRKISSNKNYTNDITVDACGNIQYPIVIQDNTVENHGEILCDGKNSGYTFLSLTDANVNLNGNVVYSDYGVGLVWGHGGSMDISMSNNNVNGLYRMGILSSSGGIQQVNITANNNVFDGDTRIYCRNVKNMDLTFKNNTFNSSNYHFFLQEAAQRTSIIFENNIVNAMAGKGAIYSKYGGDNYGFSKVSISNNTFNGIRKNDIMEPFKKERNLQIRDNIYR